MSLTPKALALRLFGSLASASAWAVNFLCNPRIFDQRPPANVTEHGQDDFIGREMAALGDFWLFRALEASLASPAKAGWPAFAQRRILMVRREARAPPLIFMLVQALRLSISHDESE